MAAQDPSSTDRLPAWQLRFVDIALRQNSGLWSDRAAAEGYLTALVQERLELADPAICHRRRDFFDLQGPTAADYAERLVALDGAALLAGIRFRSLDRDFPFLEIMADLPLAELLERLPEVTPALREAFGVFAPLGLALRLPAESLAELKMRLPGAQVWNLYLAGPPQATAPGPGLVRPETLDYQRFLAAYEQWGAAQPELRQLVSPESEADLQSALAAGLCFELWDQELCCGLIAGQALPYWDRSGIYLIEEIVFLPWQGRGYGRRLQALFMQAVQARQNYDCLWGTIHPQNQASLRTALGCGRTVQEAEVFLPF